MVAEAAELAGPGGVVGICAIGGMAGIGKTALAVHAAHLLAGRFPDGQVFLRLHGHTPGQRPADPSDALASLLQTIGVAVQHIPGDLDGRARLWRDRLAGKRMLLLLDDAAGHEQVRPLLPGSAGCLVLVTSRRHLTALEDARLISLDILPPGDAAALLARLAARPGMDPADSAVRGITRLCGYLPLAIGMLARQLLHHPTWTPSGLAATLAAARDRLALMTAENLSVAAAFDLSYRDLDPDQQRLFRRLGLHPGPDFDAYAAAALDGTGPDEARSGLDVLYDHYLLTEPAQGRYRFHDLLAEHARAMAATDPPGDRDQAITRLLEYYLHAATIAGQHLARRNPAGGSPVAADPPPRVPDLAGAKDRVAWLDAERVNLHAAVIHAAGDHAAYAVAIPAAMHGYLRHHGPWDQALTLHRVAMETARRIGDRTAEASALTDLGDIQYVNSDYRAAIESLTEAIRLSRNLVGRRGEANAMAILGYVQHLVGDDHAARTGLASALSAFRALGDRLGEVNTLAYLGSAQRANGDYSAAIETVTLALRLARNQGMTILEARLHNFLGVAQHATGDYREAIASQTRALNLYRDMGNRLGEAITLGDLGTAQLEIADFLSASVNLTRALQQHRDLGYRRGEADRLTSLGVLKRLTGDYPAAAADLARALQLYRSIGDRLGETEVLNATGELALATGAIAQARRHHEQALAIATGSSSVSEEARALEGIGQCQRREGERKQSAASLRQALAIYHHIGSPHASRIQATLRDDGQ